MGLILTDNQTRKMIMSCSKSVAQYTDNNIFTGYRSDNLLSISADAKTSKGEKMGFLTGILYLAPYKTISIYNTCSMAHIAGCDNACLYTAGRGAYSSVQNARINKTNWFYQDKQSFMLQLINNIFSLIKKANKLGLIPLIRLNGTSDIKWENIDFIYEGKYYSNVMALFPYIQFYDYTKIINRDNLPANYDLTFSYSGKPEFIKYVNKAIEKNMRIAVVFKNKDNIPNEFMGLSVVNGDNSDIRHLDKHGVIVALYAKGKAKKDNSGFVVLN
jgi:hypothetical protein